MPPAVAQAPIVISVRERRAHIVDALGVMRRRDRALDEREIVVALDRARASPRENRRSRPRPATASSSSSQSSRLSWQPSQEANFHTASRGLCFVRRSCQSSFTREQPRAIGRSVKTGPSRQMKIGPNWQWPH